MEENIQTKTKEPIFPKRSVPLFKIKTLMNRILYIYQGNLL